MIRKRSRRDSETAGNGARVTRCYFIVQATGWVSRAGRAAGPLPDHVARIGGSEEPNAGVSWWTVGVGETARPIGWSCTDDLASGTVLHADAGTA